jgi:hypothetical protein
VKQAFHDRNINFDIIIDDEPHSLRSMELAIRYFLPLLTPDGDLRDFIGELQSDESALCFPKQRDIR